MAAWPNVRNSVQDRGIRLPRAKSQSAKSRNCTFVSNSSAPKPSTAGAMLIRENFRAEFYESLKDQGHCLVLVNTDVDALCAWTILESLFKCDEFSHSVLPVTGIEDLEQKLMEHAQTTKTLLLINCGGNRNLTDLSLSEDCRVFVLDSRRPIHLDNIYDDVNIRVIIETSELQRLGIPTMEELFEPDSSDENDEQAEEDETEDRRQSRMDKIEQRIQKKQAKRAWAKNRDDLVWKYYENSWHSLSSAVFMFSLTTECAKTSQESMWCAGVGLASQYIDTLISLEFYYETTLDKLRIYLQYAPKNGLEDRSGQLFRLKFAKELLLPFYSHWSLYESMQNNELFVNRNHLWSQKGRERMHLNLASLGLTLAETKQVYNLMDRERREEVFQILYEDQHTETQTDFSTFTAQFDYSKPFNAVDFARMLAVSLEYGLRGPSNETPDERFNSSCAYLERFMNGRSAGEIDQVMNVAKKELAATVDMAIQTVKQANVTPSGGFILVKVNSVAETDYLITSRHALFTFAHLVQKAYATKASHRDRRRKPLIFAITLSGDQAGWSLLTGIMPMDGYRHEKIANRKSVPANNR
ncbi:hypothetical protein L596_025010 [Steinernema carpocapsae]|uniref:CDC45-like protein n=1 Tax=Steinernema carpocapsae TaxID=34508 RepID=A0A4U5M6J1_STECR|nr:hypothetical protein L596_025010 [Steinernema carpocapsae]